MVVTNPSLAWLAPLPRQRPLPRLLRGFGGGGVISAGRFWQYVQEEDFFVSKALQEAAKSQKGRFWHLREPEKVRLLGHRSALWLPRSAVERRKEPVRGQVLD